jgi:hypothetical protein
VGLRQLGETMLSRIGWWLLSAALFCAVMLLIRGIHLAVAKAMPDSRFKRALLKQRGIDAHSEQSLAELPGRSETLGIEGQRESFFRRSVRLTRLDPASAVLRALVVWVLGSALMIGAIFGLNWLLRVLGVIG